MACHPLYWNGYDHTHSTGEPWRLNEILKRKYVAQCMKTVRGHWMVAFIKLPFAYLADAPEETMFLLCYYYALIIIIKCHDTCHLKWFDVDCWQKWTLVKGGWVEVHLPTLLSSTFRVCKLWLQDNQGHYMHELLLNCKLHNILGQPKRARMWGNAGSKGA